MMRDSKPYLVQSVVRAMDVLRVLGDRGAMSLAELVDATQLPKPTAFRLVKTLEHAGFVEHWPESGYTLGPSFVRGARAFLSRGLREVARPHLEFLHRSSGHSVNLAVLSGAEVLYIDVLESQAGLRMVSLIGSTEPLHATAVGKAIAAELPEVLLDQLLADRPMTALTPSTIRSRSQLGRELDVVRERGYAVDDEECVVGARCLGAAIKDVTRCVGGVSISASKTLLHDEDLTALGDLVRQTAQRISEKLLLSPTTK